MILRDRRSPSYDLASLFRGRRSSLDRWTGKITKRIGTMPSVCMQLSIFEGGLAELLFWMLSSLKNEEVWQNCFVFDVANLKLRKFRLIASFLILSTLKNEDISQNCSVFDVVRFKT